MIKRSHQFLATATAILAAGLTAGQARALDVEVEVSNVGPAGGVFITPLWVGFHDGSFDSYNGGLGVQEGLERIAEDGNTAVLSGDFLDGYTYIDGGTNARVLTSQTTGRVDGTIGNSSGPPPIAPGQSVSQQFTIDADGSNRYFSYASMVLPSNDYFIANGSAVAHDLASLYGAPAGSQITFFIGQSVNDAGTEVEDFATSAANGLFPQLNIGGGQGGPECRRRPERCRHQRDGGPLRVLREHAGRLWFGPRFGLHRLYGCVLVPQRAWHKLPSRSSPSRPRSPSSGLGGLGLLRRRRRS